ncbi:hypothetical protein [Planctobacterium marinum]|uniref:hypothetical protein n=1 Tax=Planctobacterium marinum TaxID=1631968 RepID=UPI001E53CF9A|nr:hypothetical protein [Planctobacterium marinum]MCC2608002.1 hypothetical protein [Planctobacterium marinum]
MNFIDLCLSGEAFLDEIDDYVDKWHEDEESPQELHEYLGMTEKEYGYWICKPSLLPFIISSRVNGSELEEEMQPHQFSLAARAESLEEAEKTRVWLKELGKLDE